MNWAWGEHWAKVTDSATGWVLNTIRWDRGINGVCVPKPKPDTDLRSQESQSIFSEPAMQYPAASVTTWPYIYSGKTLSAWGCPHLFCAAVPALALTPPSYQIKQLSHHVLLKPPTFPSSRSLTTPGTALPTTSVPVPSWAQRFWDRGSSSFSTEVTLSRSPMTSRIISRLQGECSFLETSSGLPGPYITQL